MLLKIILANLGIAKSTSHLMDFVLFQADGTYETQSRMIFTANRYDNGVTITCQTTNQVMESMGEIPYVTSVKLQVNCKCFPKKVLSVCAISWNK